MPGECDISKSNKGVDFLAAFPAPEVTKIVGQTNVHLTASMEQYKENDGFNTTFHKIFSFKLEQYTSYHET